MLRLKDQAAIEAQQRDEERLHVGSYMGDLLPY